MARTYRPEVTPVKGDDRCGLKALRESDHGGIGSSERKVAVLLDQFGHTPPVGRNGSFDIEFGKPFEENRFCARSETGSDEVSDLGDDKSGDNDVQCVPREHLQRRVMIVVVEIGGRVQRT